jgi:DNA-directed RNA polymerase subunit RPC12/RpoP
MARTYDMSYQEILMIKEGQDYRCAICGVHEENTTKSLALDHDHATGKVRGYLCNNCNRGIGLLKDSVEVLSKAIEYLNTPLS